MPASKVEIKATFVKEVETSPFSDVSTSAYYYEAVKWAQEKGITGGIGNGLFGPNQPCTRAQIVTFLWRAAGSPEPKSMSSFSDVPADSYYAKAVAWAVENGITTGTGDGKFSPEATCTRAQSVTFLCRAVGKPFEGEVVFSDVPADSYYANAVAWAVKNKVTNGVAEGLFGPDNSCTRAQIVTFLWRAAGSPEPKSMSSFSDVSADSYYAKAVAWAVENGITTGTGDGKFSPDATCTRAQSVTFLFRAIGKLVDSKAEFSDVLTDSYYANAVAWAVENGVTNGIGDGLFGPDNSCTRAQIVTFLFRAYQGK